MADAIDTVITRFETDASGAIKAEAELAATRTAVAAATRAATAAQAEASAAAGTSATATAQAVTSSETLAASQAQVAAASGAAAVAQAGAAEAAEALAVAETEAAAATTALGGSFLAAAGPVAAMILAGYAVRKLVEAFAESNAAAKAAAEEGERFAKFNRDLTASTEAYVAAKRGATSEQLWATAELNKIAEEEYKAKAKLREIDDELFNAERLGIADTTSLLKARGDELNRLTGYEANWAAQRKAVAASLGERVNADETATAQKHEEDLQKAITAAKVAAENKDFERVLALQDAITAAKIAAANKVFEAEFNLEEAIKRKKVDAANKDFVRELKLEEDIEKAKINAANKDFENWVALSEKMEQRNAKIALEKDAKASGAAGYFKSDQAAREIAEATQRYDKLAEAARKAGQDEIGIEEAKQQEIERIRDKYQAAAIKSALATVARELQAVTSIFIPGLIAGWQKAGTQNARFTAEYSALAMKRREATLLESGVVQTSAEAHRVAAEEAQAAAEQQAAAEKQAIAERLAALAVEWAIRAVASAAEMNWPAAAAFAAAAAAAGIAANEFHSEAAAMQQGRGYTADERDQLTQLQGGTTTSAGSSSSSSGKPGAGSVTGGSEKVVEKWIYVGDPFETPAESARRLARRLALVDRLQLRSVSGTTLADATGGN